MKIVINSCYGGFGLSYQGVMEYAKNKGIKLYGFIDESSRRIYSEHGETLDLNTTKALIHYTTKPVKDEKGLNRHYWSDRGISRDDEALIKTVQKLKKKANGNCAELKIVEIPDGIGYEIGEYDGIEHIAEKHRTWG